LYVAPEAALQQIPLLADIYDEPFADSSQIPTCLVAKMARQHVTVALSGDGGDEGFLGYSRYAIARDLWRRLGRLPTPLRRAAHSFAQVALPAMSDRIARRAVLVGARTPGDLYTELISHYPVPEIARHDAYVAQTQFQVTEPEDQWVAAMGTTDAATYLPDDIMVKVDRAAMAVSLESRAPFLDHRVFEFAATLPMRYRLDGTNGKVILKELLFSMVPRQLVDRPKVGFGVPLAQWLRGPLREWASELLAPSALARHNLVDAQRVGRMWRDHLEGRGNLHYALWNVLMLQAWCERWQVSTSD
jgi:asparagine synthase (glutamine-hydrolysing)